MTAPQDTSRQRCCTALQGQTALICAKLQVLLVELRHNVYGEPKCET